ncbi:hypothetical protein K440DRAFT_183539 [Wilcoxina mikolae CBS 423.85]|nr:hypothetical protein K440DRAFT_183539 [Wilcoxina mikolae CBS 423.85]
MAQRTSTSPTVLGLKNRRKYINCRSPMEFPDTMPSHYDHSSAWNCLNLPNMEPPTASLDTLPEELLSSILSQVPTRHLVRTSSVCHRLRETANTLLSKRLCQSAILRQYNFIFECSTPSRRTITPYQHCFQKGLTSPVTPNRNLSQIYSRFIPHEPTNVHDSYSSLDATPRPVSTMVSLEENDYFAQLCANAMLIKLAPIQGMFTLLVRVLDDTFFWLRRSELRSAAMSKSARVVWLDDARNAALKIRVTEKERWPWVSSARHNLEEDEDRPVSYLVEYEEVLVRTAYLVGVMEKEEEKNAKETVVYERPYVDRDTLVPSYY